MKTFIQIFASGFTAFFLTIILIPILKKIAIKYNLVDKPNARKIHLIPVPVIGGISIGLTVILTALINPLLISGIMQQRTLYSVAIVLLILGALDDKFDINAKYKLAIQFLCALATSFSGIRIHSLYGIFGIYEIPEFAQHIITIVIITGVVNAINLMDGIDGLLGEISVLGFIVLITFSIIQQKHELTALYIAFLFATIGFLKFNLSSKKIFMGDAGSLFLGNILIGSTIYLLNQKSNSLQTQQILLFSIIGFFSIPVLDSLRVYLGRLKKGNSPFKADKTHIHHLFILMGFSHKRISLIISILSALFLGYCIFFYNYFQLSTIVISVILLFSILAFILNLNKKVCEWRETIKILESK